MVSSCCSCSFSCQAYSNIHANKKTVRKCAVFSPTLFRIWPSVQKLISPRDAEFGTKLCDSASLRETKCLSHRIAAKVASPTVGTKIAHPLATFATRNLLARGLAALLRSSRAPSCDFVSQSSSCYSSGDLTTSSQVHLALTRPGGFAAGASCSSVNLIAFGDRRMPQSTTDPSPAAQSRRRRRCRSRGWRGRWSL